MQYNQHWEIIFRLAFALFTGIVIGWERKIKSKPVGIITNAMVCLGAAILSIYQQLIMIGIQIYGFGLEFHELTSNGSRITAQIVSGIGFLGAGTIIRDKENISGITTAAVLWVMACLGIVIGSGYWFLSFIAFTYIAFILFVLKPIDAQLLDHKRSIVISLTCDSSIDINKLFTEFDLKISRYTVTKIKHVDGRWIRTVLIRTMLPPYINPEKMTKEISTQAGIMHCAYKGANAHPSFFGFRFGAKKKKILPKE